MAKYYIPAYIFGQEEECLSQLFICRSGSPHILLKNNIPASWISVLNYHPCLRIDELSSGVRGGKNFIISYWQVKKICNSDLGTEVSSQLLDLNICMYIKAHMESLQTNIKVREQSNIKLFSVRKLTKEYKTPEIAAITCICCYNASGKVTVWQGEESAPFQLKHPKAISSLVDVRSPCRFGILRNREGYLHSLFCTLAFSPCAPLFISQLFSVIICSIMFPPE